MTADSCGGQSTASDHGYTCGLLCGSSSWMLSARVSRRLKLVWGLAKWKWTSDPSIENGSPPGVTPEARVTYVGPSGGPSAGGGSLLQCVAFSLTTSTTPPLAFSSVSETGTVAEPRTSCTYTPSGPPSRRGTWTTLETIVRPPLTRSR